MAGDEGKPVVEEPGAGAAAEATAPEPPPPEGAPASGGGLQDTLRKALLAGMGALFLTEEGARRLAREWKLPKELIGFLGSQASGAKDEILRIFSDEVRRFFESEAMRREVARTLSSMVVEVKAEIRVRPAEDGRLEPQVKAEVRAHRADRKRKGEPD
jgi:hypothetical protein